MSRTRIPRGLIAAAALMALTPATALELIDDAGLATVVGGLFVDGQACTAAQNGCPNLFPGDCKECGTWIAPGGGEFPLYCKYLQATAWTDCEDAPGEVCDAHDLSQPSEWASCGTMKVAQSCGELGSGAYITVPGCTH